MKTLTCYFSLLLCFPAFGQVIQEKENDEGHFEYLFTLDQFSKPLSLPIEVNHMGGNITQLKGTFKNSDVSSTIRFRDEDESVLFEKIMNDDASFEFNTDRKLVIIELERTGYITYERAVKLETLSVFVIKLQPEASEDIYQLKSTKKMEEKQLNSFMECVYKNRSSKLATCAEEYEVELTVQ